MVLKCDSFMEILNRYTKLNLNLSSINLWLQANKNKSPNYQPHHFLFILHSFYSSLLLHKSNETNDFLSLLLSLA